MKKIAIFVVILVVAYGGIKAANASASAGILPGSKLYGLDKALERLDEAVTFGAANKAKLEVSFAKERQAELASVTLVSNTSEAKTALAGLVENKTKAKDEIEKISDPTQKKQLSKEVDDDFDQIEHSVNDNLGQQIKSLIEAFKPKREALQKQIQDANKAGNKTLVNQLRTQLLDEEKALRDQIHALQAQLDPTDNQLKDIEKELEDNLDQQEKVNEQKQDSEQDKADQEDELKAQTDELNTHINDLKQGSHDPQELKQVETEKQQIENELEND